MRHVSQVEGRNAEPVISFKFKQTGHMPNKKFIIILLSAVAKQGAATFFCKSILNPRQL
jgi:hypothetical protein